MKVANMTNENVAEEMNSFVRNVSLGDNMSGQIVSDIFLPAGSTVEVPHNLKVTPKYRIILRQRSSGIISDGDKAWTDRAIYLKNNGLLDDTVTILIMRD